MSTLAETGIIYYIGKIINGLRQAFCLVVNIPPGVCADRENIRGNGFRG